MAQKTFASNKSSLFADGSSNLGGGADPHMPVGGPYSGYVFRSAVRFALDYAGVKSISSAILRLKTSDQAHVAFSSDPDIYVARATTDWSANGNSGSGDGGSGWGTSPTVYPGPTTTNTGRVTKDVTTSQNATVDIDITQIVKDWAPTSVIGGGNAPNYGVLLYYVASGDITEFYSYRHGSSGNRPSLILNYNTDSPPSATMDGPTGVQATTRPTLSGTATDPDGDAITNVGLGVYRASDNVLVYYADTGPVGSSWSHVPTSDLPGGALWAAATPQAGGLTGAASSQVTFTVDRPPNPPIGLQPTGNVSGNRRPLHQFSYDDPDGDVGELYDLEIYQSVAGAPSGTAIYTAASQTAGLAPGSLQHTPNVDLPGGPMLARARVRSGPADLWSSWSAWLAYSIILTTPTVVWVEPVAANAFEQFDPPTFANSGASILTTAIWGRVNDAPPAGQTLTREARGYAYETAAAAWAYDGPPQAPNTPTGGTASQPIYASNGAVAPYGRGHYRFIIGASGGGTVDTQRTFRASILEWYGVLYLGDNVTAIAAALAAVGGQAHGWIRAQAAKNVTSAPWRELSDTAALIAELPKQGAYLGLKARYAYTALDAELHPNPEFDNGLTGWSAYAGPLPQVVPDATYGNAARFQGNGTSTDVQVMGSVPVVPGATYRVTAALYGPGVSGVSTVCQVDARGKATVFNVVNLSQAGLAWVEPFALYTVPADGSVLTLTPRIGLYGGGATIASAVGYVGRTSIIGPVPNVAGLDKWSIDWTSAG